MKWLAGILAAVVLAGGGTALYLHYWIEGDPRELAADYFAYWRAGDFYGMRGLAASPPADFVEQHRGFSASLQVKALRLEQGALTRPTEETAEVPFEAVRTLPPGEWRVKSVVRMRIVDRRWRVVWTAATLLPELKKGGRLALTRTESSASTVTDRGGRKLPEDSSIQEYAAGLSTSYGGEAGEPGWAVTLDRTPLKVFSAPRGAELKTTIDAKTQRAADAAAKSSARPAAVVVLRPSTGEILAIADHLDVAKAAVNGRYPPGSTFKVVTAAALVAGGLTPSSKVACPGRQLIGQRTIPNHDGLDLGITTLHQAFAHSCNTTFSSLAVERAEAGGMKEASVLFGFNRAFAHNAARASFPESPGTTALAEAAIGQGEVLAS
ncbi:penicillin-binding transpeptidase domain-containing protein, partial [Actinocorallia aurantiaca]|uniref:penicillin-binding transpeptidase domain-containing protein n=1 Tax=Actinocorallia aurantiaca TaxID=46204 RepID=UPI0031CF52FD